MSHSVSVGLKPTNACLYRAMFVGLSFFPLEFWVNPHSPSRTLTYITLITTIIAIVIVIYSNVNDTIKKTIIIIYNSYFCYITTTYFNNNNNNHNNSSKNKVNHHLGGWNGRRAPILIVDIHPDVPILFSLHPQIHAMKSHHFSIISRFPTFRYSLI